MRAAFKHDIAFEVIPAGDSAEAQAKVKELVGTRQYFQAFLPDGSRLVHTVQRCACVPAYRWSGWWGCFLTTSAPCLLPPRDAISRPPS